MPLLSEALNADNDPIWRLSANGRIFVASDADENDLVTGQTSFAATTPTFLLQVPSGTTCVPLAVNLSQTGSVAGGAVDIIIELDDIDRYSSGGTAETVLCTNRALARTAACAVYSNPTAAAGYGTRLWAATIGQDVSPAEGAVPGPFWKPDFPITIVGPASLLVFTYAGTTGPTWFWSISFAEYPTKALP